MPDESSTVAVQDRTAAESGAHEAAGGGAGGTNGEKTGTQAAEQDGKDQAKGIESDSLPAELEETRKSLLKDYHAKTQKLSEERRKLESDISKYKDSAETLEKLMEQPWFKEAYQQQRSNRGQSAGQELTDEEFAAATSDKRAFHDLVAKVADRIVQSKYGETITNVKSKTEELAAERAFDRMANHPKHGKRFKELADEGALDAYVKIGYSYEDAYAKHLLENDDSLEDKARDFAREMIQGKKSGSVEKPGAPKVAGERKVKVKDFWDAFDKQWEAHQKGESIITEKE